MSAEARVFHDPGASPLFAWDAVTDSCADGCDHAGTLDSVMKGAEDCLGHELWWTPATGAAIAVLNGYMVPR